MTSPALQERMLALLDEARAEVMKGELESLAVIGRNPHTQQYMSFFVHAIGADICGLFGFMMVCLQKAVQIDVEQSNADGDGRPVEVRTKVLQ